MFANRELTTLLSGLPESKRREVQCFLALSERKSRRYPEETIEELLVSLAFFNRAKLHAN